MAILEDSDRVTLGVLKLVHVTSDLTQVTLRRRMECHVREIQYRDSF
jgi:hypothetical protein